MEDKNCIVTFGNDKSINIKFKYLKDISTKETRIYTFKRNQDETVKSLCRRIGLNLAGKKNTNTEVPDIFFTKLNSRIADEVAISEVFKEDTSQFHIDKITYEIVLEPPEVKKVVLPKSQVFVGFRVVPIVEYYNCTYQECQFTWYRSKMANSKKWLEVSKNIFYIPCATDEGCYLKLECVPNNGGLLFGAEAITGCKVKKGPDCIFWERPLPAQIPDGSFTCTSYNILADLYADPDIKHKKSMFPYCPKEALQFAYRKNLILEELIYYNSDIVCLQEVDKEYFNKDLSTYFKCQGYEAIFNEKVEKAEGLAMLVNKAKFNLESSHFIAYGKELETNPLFTDLQDYIMAHSPSLLQKLLSLGTVLQISEVTSVEDGQRLLIANTHLYYAPGFTILRLIQSYIAIRYMEDLLKSKGGDSTSVIWCGDFNSGPQYATYSFISTGHFPASHPEWTLVPECSLKGLELTHSLQLSSACGTPEFTNYTKDFVACLDYIFVDTKHLEVCSTLPIPSKKTVSKHEALPSYLHPSDHIALVSTLKPKPQQNNP